MCPDNSNILCWLYSLILFHTLIFLRWKLHGCHTNFMNVSLQLRRYSIEVHILSFAIMVNASRVRCLATNAPLKSYFSDIFKLILLQIERNLSYERDNPREKKRLITVFRGKRCIQFQTDISWYRCFSLSLTCLRNEVTDGEWPVIFLYWYITNCVMVLDD